MTKRKPKKSLRARTRNPKTMIQDQPPPPPPATEMIQVVEEEEDEIQIQNPNNETTIEATEKEEEEEKETVQQSDEITSTNPKLIEEDEITSTNPKLIEEEGDEPETIPEDPKSIEKEDETTTTDSVSVHEELKTQSLKMIVEEEEEEEHDQPSQAHEEEEDDDDEEEEPESMAMSPMASNQQQTEGMTTLSSPVHDDDDTIMCELVSESPPPTLTRKSSSARKRKKPSNKYQRKPLNRKQRAALEVKLQCCRENLQPIPFVPPKTLDFSKHEELFKRLGLWDFVHIEFDQKIRNDLLSQLIVSYKDRSSTVNDLKIKVNRADLGRALKLPLPVKKDKNSLPETMDLDAEVLSEESISFLDEFVSNWFLLHEDMWMMPDEVLNNTRCIKEGQPEKVDWPGLIWFMVEKELSQGPKLKSCYYASHLQYLMRSQKDVLFKEEPKMEASMEIKEENADVERICLEEIQEEELGKQHIELALGQEKNNVEQQVGDGDEDVMDFQECKEPGDSSQWFLDGKNNFEEHCFRRCNNVVKIDGLDDQCAVKEEEHEEDKYDLSSKCDLGGLTSTDLLQGMGTTNIPYSPSMQLQLQLLDDNSGDLLQTRSSTHMNQGGPSMFGNTCKRALSHVEEEEEEEDEEEDDIQHDIFGDHNKRMRNSGSWENKASDTDLDYCMDQINSWAAKARVIHAQKNEVSMNAQMNQQYLMSELQQRDDLIANLHKTKCEEIQRREIDMYKLEHELRMMSSLLVGYRTALKQTQREFSEYRERCPEPEEPLYKDVPGGGGLVLSTMELEKQRLEREEEEKMQRRFFEEQMKKFEGSCIAALEVSKEKVHLLDKRLLELEGEFKVLKEVLSAKHKMPEEHEVLSAKHKMPEEEGCIAEVEEEKV